MKRWLEHFSQVQCLSVCGEGSIIIAIHEELDVPPLEDEILAKEEWGVARDAVGMTRATVLNRFGRKAMFPLSGEMH